jgi:geranylgeranyl reductase family protein
MDAAAHLLERHHIVIEADVLVVGAGPGGVATSVFLSKYGIKHIVIDRAVFPRDKVCGDACSGKTALVINRANPEWLQEIRNRSQEFLPSWGITFVAPNGKPIDIPFHPDPRPDTPAPGFTVPRLEFDQFLVEKLTSPYCQFFQGADNLAFDATLPAVNASFNAGGNYYEVVARVVVGADGDKSAVRNHFAGDLFAPKAYAAGVRAYFEGVTGMHPQNYIELHFLKEVLPGYLWIFPLPHGRANVGLGILSEVVREKKLNLREMLLAAVNQNKGLAPRFVQAEMLGKIQGWGLPLATEKHHLSGDGFLLVGDAGGLVDPFSGEGIGNAMYSGMLAADAIRSALEKGNLSASFIRAAYDDVFYQRLGDELKISTTMMHMSRMHWLFNFVINKAHKSASLRKTISCMFTDMDLRSQLSNPAFYLKVLLNR